MWTTLALAALAFTPAQSGQLQLANDRPTYGIMGATRPDGKVLPGDVYCVTFDVLHLQEDQSGKVSYSMGLELTNPKGKTQFKRDPQEMEVVNGLGGHSMPAFAAVEIGTDYPAGEYTLKVTVTDRAAKATQTLTRRFEVTPMTFGIVLLRTSYATQGLPPAPSIGVAGQTIMVDYAAVGFQRDSKKQPNVTGAMEIVDEQNKPVLPQEAVSENIMNAANKEALSTAEILPLHFTVFLNRPGKFTVKVKAIDKVGNKVAEASLPLTVLDSK
jgi:hypothetical protein